MVATLALAPGLLTNVILKSHWGRPRPIDVVEFGGDQHFVPWWDPRGDCPDNCSFVAGEPSGRVLDAGAGRAGAAGLAAARLCGRARVRGRQSGSCAWPAAGISSPMSRSPACSPS